VFVVTDHASSVLFGACSLTK